MAATLILAGCAGNSDNAQVPYAGVCGAPGQPPCLGPNAQACGTGLVWNGVACASPTLNPGGYIRYFGALSGVDSQKARDIVLTLQGCRRYLIAGPLSTCGRPFDFGAGSIEVMLTPSPMGQFYVVTLTLGGSKYVYNGIYGQNSPFPNYGYYGRLAVGMDLTGQAALYPAAATNNGSQLVMQYYNWRIDVLIPGLILDASTVATQVNSVEVRIDGNHFATTELARLPY